MSVRVAEEAAGLLAAGHRRGQELGTSGLELVVGRHAVGDAHGEQVVPDVRVGRRREADRRFVVRRIAAGDDQDPGIPEAQHDRRPTVFAV